MVDCFPGHFRCLTGHEPLSWQRRLYQRWAAGDLDRYALIDLPTGLGKTLVMPLWLLARARQILEGRTPCLPTRLVYVVDRRTVVDQATDTRASCNTIER